MNILGSVGLPTSGTYTLNFTADLDTTHICIVTGVDTTVDFTVLIASMAKFVTQTVNVPNIVIAVPSKYRFGFNGQEKVDEVAGVGNHLVYKYREYDPRDIRFWSPDPLHASYPWNGDYNFAECSPIMGIDLEGLELLPVNSSMYRMSYGGSTTFLKATTHNYSVATIQKNIPPSLTNDAGKIMYNLGAPVGTNGQNYQGAYLKDLSLLDIPDFDGKAEDARGTRDIIALRPNHIPDRSPTPAAGVGPGASSGRHLTGIGVNQANQFVWNANAKQNKDRAAFYKATNLVDNSNISQKYTGGIDRANLINIITDGTLPQLNIQGKGLMQLQSDKAALVNLYQTATAIMNSNGVTVSEELKNNYQQQIGAIDAASKTATSSTTTSQSSQTTTQSSKTE